MGDSANLREEKLESTEIFDGKLLHIFRDEARLPNGNTAVREWINHPGASAVVPVFKNGDTMLVKQFRYPLQQLFWEVPAGKIDAGEDPEKTAVRETREETGLRCESMHYLGPFHPCIGYSNEVIHVYCAWNITESEPQVDTDEFLEGRHLPFREAVSMMHDGRITDGKSIVSLSRAWHWWQQKGPFKI